MGLRAIVLCLAYVGALVLACPNITGTLSWRDYAIAAAIALYAELRLMLKSAIVVSQSNGRLPTRTVFTFVKVDGVTVWEVEREKPIPRKRTVEVGFEQLGKVETDA